MTPRTPDGTPDDTPDHPHAAAIIPLYQRHARHYAADRGTTLIERPWLDAFLALVPPGAPVLDIGCGPAHPIATHLAAAGHPVTGIDSAPAMLGLARQNLPAHEFIHADMRTLALGRTFAGLLAWDSVFHLTYADQRRMLPIFAAHAAPGAPLLFTTGPAHGTALGTYRGDPLFHASLAPGEYRALLAAHGFSVRRHIAEDPACGHHTVWLAQKAPENPAP